MKIIRDAVHGDILINEIEKKVLDSAPMQRLRYISQLPGISSVYPSATHTRFEHSLGVLHFTDIFTKNLKLSEEDREALKIAALLHDVGHSAFSHVGEEILKNFSHEKNSLKIFKEKIAPLVESRLNAKKIEKYLKGKGYGIIISGDLGTDRLDYLLRDSYFTGGVYGKIDAQRLLDSMEIYKNKLVVPEKSISTAESLLLARYFMFSAVYLHPTARIAKEMISKGLRIAMKNGWISRDEIINGRDFELLFYLKELGSSIIGSYLERGLFKKALVITPSPAFKSFLHSSNARGKIEEFLKQYFEENDFVVCIPDYPSQNFEVNIKQKKKVVQLKEISPLVKTLQALPLQNTFILATKPKIRLEASARMKKFISNF